MPTTFDRTWQMSFNNIMDSTSASTVLKNSVWQLKAMLKGEITLNDKTATPIGVPAGLWTCYYSCDGTTAGTAGDAVDRWTSVYTVGKLIDSNVGAHSWMVLKSPTNFGGVSGFVYMVLDLNQNSGNSITCTVSRSAPTGGTTTARPTATDEIGGIWASFTGGFSAARSHGGISSLGEWYFITSSNNSQFCGTGMLVSLLDAKPVDTFPFYLNIGGGNSITTRSFWPGNAQASQPSTAYSRDKSNLTTVHPSLCPWCGVTNASQRVFANQTTTDVTDSAYDDLPIYVFVSVPSLYTLKGRLPDFRWAPEGTTEPSYEPAAGTPVSFIVSGMWVPTYIIPTF